MSSRPAPIARVRQWAAGLADHPQFKGHAHTLRRARVGLFVLGAVASLFWVVALFSPQWQYEDDQVRADTSASTPYLDVVAEELRQASVYVDPLLADTVGSEVVTDRVRQRIAESPVPIRLAAFPVAGGDATNGQPRVHLARLVEAVGEDGVYLHLGQNRILVLQLRDPEVTSLGLPNGSQVDEADLLALIEDIPGQLDEQRDKPWILNALMLGLAVSALLWCLVRLVELATRRDRSYLAGFRR